CCRGGREFAVSELSTRLPVRDAAEGRIATVRRYAPVRRCREQQLRPRSCSSLAQQFVTRADRTAAAAEELALLARGLGIWRHCDIEFAPRAVEFVGKYLHLSGARTLSHVADGRIEPDAAIGPDADPRRQVALLLRRPPGGEQKCAADGPAHEFA